MSIHKFDAILLSLPNALTGDKFKMNLNQTQADIDFFPYLYELLSHTSHVLHHAFIKGLLTNKQEEEKEGLQPIGIYREMLSYLCEPIIK